MSDRSLLLKSGCAAVALSTVIGGSVAAKVNTRPTIVESFIKSAKIGGPLAGVDRSTQFKLTFRLKDMSYPEQRTDQKAFLTVVRGCRIYSSEATSDGYAVIVDCNPEGTPPTGQQYFQRLASYDLVYRKGRVSQVNYGIGVLPVFCPDCASK